MTSSYSKFFEHEPEVPRIILTSFQRSGSVFFEKLLLNNLKIYIYKTHDKISKTGNEILISLIRNPYDTILSAVSMVTHYSNNAFVQTVLPDISKQYLDYYKYLDKKCSDSSIDIVIDFETLISMPKELITELATRFGISYPTNILTTLSKESKKEENHLYTSKISDQYLLVKSKMEEIDLSEHFSIYNKILKSDKILTIARS